VTGTRPPHDRRSGTDATPADDGRLRAALSALDAQEKVVDRFRRLLGPPPPPSVPGIEVAYLYEPKGAEVAAIGGDFIDLFSGRNLHQIGVAIGDVSGKGIEAAATAVIAKYALRAVVATLRWPPQPGSALMEVQNALVDQLDDGAFLTLAFVVANARDGRVGFASAGHPAPIVLRHTGGRPLIERPLAFTAPAIGFTGEAELQPLPTEHVDLGPGDAVLLYTDGIAEARDGRGRFYDEARLEEALGQLGGLPAAELPQRLFDDVCRFAGGPPADDAAVVLLRRQVSG
jgi:phosphoserine phosphatase RsbU/P